MCELSARITPGDAKCLQYRGSYNDTCRWCDEFVSVLPEVVPVVDVADPVEVKDMARPKAVIRGLRKGDKFTCPGCGRENAVYECYGLCGGCNFKRRKAAKADAVAKAKPVKVKPTLPTGPVLKPAADYPDLNADAAEVAESFGKVANSDGDMVPFGVDPMIHMALRDAWYQLEHKALVALSGLPPASMLVRAAGLVQSLQNLEVQS